MEYIEGLPRVSRIVEASFPFEWTEDQRRFHQWLQVKAIEPSVYMQVATEAWTSIHSSLEKYINWEDKQAVKHVSYVSAGKQWMKDYNVVPKITEHYIRTERYQWTIDLVAEMAWDLWIIDWKTWSIAQDLLWTKWPNWKWRKPYEKLKKATLQLSLYAEAEGIENIAVVELCDGNYHFHPLEKKSKEELKLLIDNYYKTCFSLIT